MSGTTRPRLLVIVADCHGEPPVGPLLDRIRSSLLDAYEFELLALDDRPAGIAPGRDGAPVGPEAPPVAVTVLSSAERPGYGGTRKIGFQFALERGFDAVAVLSGPDPALAACLPALVEPLASGRADAVIGAPTPRAGKPRIGLLARIQNRLIGASLSEYRSACRAYAASALRRVPFRLNANGTAFDTEIVIQFLSAGLRIAEVPVDTGLGSAPRGFRYARDAVLASARAKAQDWSLFYDRKFDCVSSAESNAHYKPRLGFESAHTHALARIPAGARVLDIGCAGGYLGRELRRRGCRVTGVDRLPLDPGCELDAFAICDFNDRPFPADLSDIDVAVMLDVIEHLASPEAFVDDFIDAAARNPRVTLVASTGNVAFAPIRLMLLAGQFNYGKRGILDLTHTRLFTFGTFRRLFEQAGFEVLELRGVPAPFPLALGHGVLARTLLGVNRVLVRISRSLFAFQILAVVRPRPGLACALDRARAASERRARALDGAGTPD